MELRCDGIGLLTLTEALHEAAVRAAETGKEVAVVWEDGEGYWTVLMDKAPTNDHEGIVLYVVRYHKGG